MKDRAAIFRESTIDARFVQTRGLNISVVKPEKHSRAHTNPPSERERLADEISTRLLAQPVLFGGSMKSKYSFPVGASGFLRDELPKPSSPTRKQNFAK